MPNITPAVLMMFRDEADIIQKSLEHWHTLGVRNFYLCDNGSDDGSQEIAFGFVRQYAEKSQCITHRSDTWEGRKVYNLLKMAALKDGCHWLFPADADEFLQLPTGNLRTDEDFEREFLASRLADAPFWKETIFDWLAQYPQAPAVGLMPYLNIYPSGREVWQEPQRKCFGYFTPDMTISVGNHLVENHTPTLDPLGAYYRHYSVRSYPQFRWKMINWMTAFQGSEFPDHPHVANFHRWKAEGEPFLQSLYNELNQPPHEPAPKWL